MQVTSFVSEKIKGLENISKYLEQFQNWVGHCAYSPLPEDFLVILVTKNEIADIKVF